MKNNDQLIRIRHYTFAEMIAFADFFAGNVRKYVKPEIAIRHFIDAEICAFDDNVACQIVRLIETAVAYYYDLPVQQIRSNRRFTELVKARQVIAYLATQYLTQREVADAIPTSRDNIQAQKNKCETLMDVDRLLKREVEQIHAQIDGRAKQIKLEAAEKIGQNINQISQ